jgi:hypothetical protein
MPKYDFRFPSDNQPLQASQVSQRFTTLVSEAVALQARGSSSGALPIKARHDDAAATCYFVTIIRKVEKEDRASLDGWAIAS